MQELINYRFFRFYTRIQGFIRDLDNLEFDGEGTLCIVFAAPNFGFYPGIVPSVQNSVFQIYKKSKKAKKVSKINLQW